MGLRINTNVASIAAQKNLRQTSEKQGSVLQKLASGNKIVRAADDSAGLAISEKMKAQIRGTNQAKRNAEDGVSMVQTAEGALGEVENILQRMRELSVQAGNSTLNQTDRNQIQLEMDQLANEIDSIASKTHFNNVKLLDGGSEKVTMQIGANETDALDIALQHTSVESLGIGSIETTSPSSVYVTDRVTVIEDTIAATDIKLNGENLFASNYTPAATTVRGTSGDHNGTLSGTAGDDGQFPAIALAEAINKNFVNHGVKAEAFNIVTTTVKEYANTNIIIKNGFKGLKTGWTSGAGLTFIGYNQENNRNILTIVNKSYVDIDKESHFEDTLILYKESVSNFQNNILLNKSDNVYMVINSYKSIYHKFEKQYVKFGNVNISDNVYLKSIDSSKILLGNNYDEESEEINLIKSKNRIQYNFLMSNIISKLLVSN